MSAIRVGQRVNHPDYPLGGLVYVGVAERFGYEDPPHSLVILQEKYLAVDDLHALKGQSLRVPTATLSRFTLPITRNPRNLAAFLALCGAAIRKGWPLIHADDLLAYDAATLGVHADCVLADEMPDGTPFGWILRDHGTEFCRPGVSDRDSPASYWKNPSYLPFWWDGKQLTQLQTVGDILTKMGEYRRAKAR